MGFVTILVLAALYINGKNKGKDSKKILESQYKFPVK
jgi:hypothetical protein